MRFSRLALLGSAPLLLNQGLAGAKGRFKQTVYLSTDNRLDADDTIVAEQELDGELPAGQSCSPASR